MVEKRTRRTRAELREMMLAAGQEVLLRAEPTLGFEELTYTEVFDHLQVHYEQKVTIGSVHERIWASQREFQLAVLDEVLHDSVELVTANYSNRMVEVIGALPLETVDQRKYAIRVAIRNSSHFLSPSSTPPAIDVAHRVRFRLWAVGRDHPEAVGVASTIADIRRVSTDAHANVVRLGMQVVGMRVRADAGDPDEVIDEIAILGNAVLLGLRTDILPAAHATRALPTGPNGELEDWYPDATALWALVRCMLELDGDDLTDDERRL